MTAVRFVRRAALVAGAIVIAAIGLRAQQAPLPELTAPVNDFAHVIDAGSLAAMDQMIRSLQQANGDVVVVATVDTIAPYTVIDDYAVKLFENHRRGIGQKERDTGLLVLLAVKERRVRVEVGYGLEQYITDGFAGETIRQVMTPEFRQGRYGDGLRAGVERIIGRIAEAQHLQLQGVRPVQHDRPGHGWVGFAVIVGIFLLVSLASRGRGGPMSPTRRWGGGGWSGWTSGIGPFGGSGGFGGGFGGFGGGGGGFGGFGGGGSGGGGASGGW
jgi:uncharacterized protein